MVTIPDGARKEVEYMFHYEIAMMVETHNIPHSMIPRNFKNRRNNNSLHSIETGLVAFAGTIIHFKFEFTAKA